MGKMPPATYGLWTFLVWAFVAPALLALHLKGYGFAPWELAAAAAILGAWLSETAVRAWPVVAGWLAGPDDDAG